MIKVWSDKQLAFNQGDLDSKGNAIRVIAKVGFNSLPDWVEQDKYYVKAVEAGVIKPYVSTADADRVEVKRQELAQVNRELEDKKRELAALSAPEVAIIDNPVETESSGKRGRKSTKDITA